MGSLRNVDWSWVYATPTRWLLLLAGAGAWVGMFAAAGAAGAASDDWVAMRCPGTMPLAQIAGPFWIGLGCAVLAVFCFFAATVLFAAAARRLAWVRLAIGITVVMVAVLLIPIDVLFVLTDPSNAC